MPNLLAGTELVGLAASETPNPRETMPSAVKGTFWRIVSFEWSLEFIMILTAVQTIIYITSLTIIGLLVPYTEERLIGGSGACEYCRGSHPFTLDRLLTALSSAASPFVIALKNAGINGLDRAFF